MWLVRQIVLFKICDMNMHYTEKVYVIVFCVENITIKCLCFECTMFMNMWADTLILRAVVMCSMHIKSILYTIFFGKYEGLGKWN